MMTFLANHVKFELHRFASDLYFVCFWYFSFEFEHMLGFVEQFSSMCAR
jgi:hypothetical protein